jgi:Holliday junction resolvase RusA-like endonuclease
MKQLICKLDLKPMSVNVAWQGKRFKSKEYKKYESNALLLLPNNTMPPPPFRFEITFGLSNKLNDIDNAIKPTLDIMKKKYGFNDKGIYELHVYKQIVAKGQEFTSIKVTTI